MTRDDTNRVSAGRLSRCRAAILSITLLAHVALSASVHAQSEPADALRRLTEGGHVLMIRHALAPGTGDPPEFRLGDCATQRNLDERGRTQARAIGDWLRARGVTAAEVYSSQWCRGWR